MCICWWMNFVNIRMHGATIKIISALHLFGEDAKNMYSFRRYEIWHHLGFKDLFWRKFQLYNTSANDCLAVRFWLSDFINCLMCSAASDLIALRRMVTRQHRTVYSLQLAWKWVLFKEWMSANRKWIFSVANTNVAHWTQT